MEKEKTAVKIKSEYYQEIEKIVAQSSQFRTVSEYINVILQEMLFGDANFERTETEENLIKKRLQGLGYM